RLMGDKSGIEWTDATWNPTTGCDRVSPGCANCYAMTLAPRLKSMHIAARKKKGLPVLDTDPYMLDGDPKTSGPGFGFMMHPDKLDQPLRWSKPRMVFVNSMSDLWHEEMNYHFLDSIFAVMAMAKQHTVQVLTKRPERMLAYMTETREGVATEGWVRTAAVRDWDMKGEQWADWQWPLPNVWLGTSVEIARWRTRIDALRQVPAAVRFLSCEPLLGPLVCPACKGWGWDVEVHGSEPVQVQCPEPRFASGHDLDLKGIDWVIVGGESGSGARPMNE